MNDGISTSGVESIAVFYKIKPQTPLNVITMLRVFYCIGNIITSDCLTNTHSTDVDRSVTIQIKTHLNPLLDIIKTKMYS